MHRVGCHSICRVKSYTRNTTSNLYWVNVACANLKEIWWINYFNLGLSIFYDRVLCLPAEMGNSVCQCLYMERVVCPSMLKSNIFTTAAVDNIDHNPSATTTKDSLHGTDISLIQHPTSAIEGLHSGSVIIESNTCSKIASCLPHNTDMPPVTSTVKLSALPTTSVTSLARKNYKKHAEGEYRWLENARHVLEEYAELENVSWVAYHAKHQES